LKTGTAEDLAADEMVRRVYLGRNFELRISPQIARERKEREERERQEALRALGHISNEELEPSDDEELDEAEEVAKTPTEVEALPNVDVMLEESQGESEKTSTDVVEVEEQQ
jgi:lipopolysaccharide export system ATP-binding protein